MKNFKIFLKDLIHNDFERNHQIGHAALSFASESVMLLRDLLK